MLNISYSILQPFSLDECLVHNSQRCDRPFSGPLRPPYPPAAQDLCDDNHSTSSRPSPSTDACCAHTGTSSRRRNESWATCMSRASLGCIGMLRIRCISYVLMGVHASMGSEKLTRWARLGSSPNGSSMRKCWRAMCGRARRWIRGKLRK